MKKLFLVIVALYGLFVSAEAQEIATLPTASAGVDIDVIAVDQASNAPLVLY